MSLFKLLASQIIRCAFDVEELRDLLQISSIIDNILFLKTSELAAKV